MATLSDFININNKPLNNLYHANQPSQA